MRLLLISYYFPPCGGAPVQRWLKWLPDLVQNGIEVTVLTTRDGDYPAWDDSLLAEVPPEVKVIRTSTPRTGKLWKLFLGKNKALPNVDMSKTASDGLLSRILVWLRLNLIIPDMRMFWNPLAYPAAINILRENPIDILITTGPPHSTHLLGLKLKKRFKLPWLADWRDPWTSIHYLKLNPPSALSMRIHRHFERKVALGSDLNIIVSKQWAEELPGNNTQVVCNGYDARQFAALSSSRNGSRANDCFRLKHVGNITEGQKFEALLCIISEALQGADFELSFVGTRLSQEQIGIMDQLIPGKYRIGGFVSRLEALQEMIDAQVLLLLIYYAGSGGLLTTKMYEYIASGTKILCLGPQGGEAEETITEYGAGAYFDTSQTESAAEYLRDLYLAWQRGEDLKNKKDVSALSSQTQAVKLIGLLRGLENG